MAISVSKTFAAGEILTATDLNGIESNIITNAQDLTTPRTKAFDMDGFEITLDSDGDTSILSDSDDRIDLKVQGVDGFRFDGKTASSVMGLDFITATTGNHPEIIAQGTDTNSSVKISGKGTGGVEIAQIVDSNGLEVLAFANVASAVNELQITNAATTNGVLIDATGDDTDIDVLLKGKGAGVIKIGDGELAFPDSDGTANQAIITNGSGTLSFANAVVSLAELRGFIGGYVLSNDTDTDHDINISAGSCLNSAADTMMQRAEITKKIDVNWAAGDDQGGFPSALSLTNDKWYHVFIIEDGSGTVDAGFDTSITATNLLSDSSYTNYRRVGSVLTDGSSNIIGFKQRGDLFLWNSPTLDVDITLATGTPQTVAIPVPPDVEVMAHLNVRAAAGTFSSAYFFSPDITDDAAADAGSAPLSTVSTSGSGTRHYSQISVVTDSSSQIRGDSATTNMTLDMVTLGWRDPLGRWD